jgi:hypothetical protein
MPSVIRYKWGDESLKEGITSIPKRGLRVLSRIFIGEDGVEQLQVALTLVDYRRPNSNRLPTAAFLAFLSGLSEERFMIRLQQLHDRRLITFEIVRKAIKFNVNGLIDEMVAQSMWQPPIDSDE